MGKFRYNRCIVNGISSGIVLAGLLISVACTRSLPHQKELRSGTYIDTVDMTFRGFKRDYLVHIPEGYAQDRSYPLVVAIHGAFSSASDFESVSGFSELADKEGFIAVYPNGVGIFGLLRHWNAGHCCAFAAENKIDDIGFVKLIIDDLSRRLPIERDRIFLAGFSNGGMLVHRFAAEYPNLIAALACISSTIGSKQVDSQDEWKLKQPLLPLSVLIAHGKDDESIPYSGEFAFESNNDIRFHSVEQSVDFWLKSNHCSQNQQRNSERENRVEKSTWPDCAAASRVTLYSIKGWGHRWPGKSRTTSLPENDPLFGFDITKEIWNFFTVQETP